MKLPANSSLTTRLAGATLLIVVGVLFTSTASAQSGEWKEWSSARYYWEMDRSELESERDQNLSVRDRLRLKEREYQSDTAGLTPAPLGITRVGSRSAVPVQPEPRAQPKPRAQPEPRRAAVDNERQRREEERLHKEEERRIAAQDRKREAEDKRKRQEDRRRQASEKKRLQIEAEKQAAQERQQRLDDAKAKAIARKREEFEARKSKAKKKEKAKKIEKEVLKEDTNTRGQVMDNEIQNLLDEIE